MNGKLKATLLSILMVLIPFLGITPQAQATEFDSQEIVVDIDENGDAHFTETWQVDDDRGTERFISFGNLLENQEIADFHVEENGTLFQTVPNWNSKDSREEKAGKSGIQVNKKGDTELCWGIGEYGPHTYKVTYTVRNLVVNLPDAQAINWRFIQTGITDGPKNLRVIIRSPLFNADNVTEPLNFGNEGSFVYENDQLEYQLNSQFDTDLGLALMAKIEPGTFSTNAQDSKTYQELVDISKEGARSAVDDSFWGRWKGWIIGALILIPTLILALGGALLAVVGTSKEKRLRNQFLDDPSFTAVASNYGRPPVFQLDRLFSLAKNANSDLHRDMRQNLLSAYIVKWVLDGRIRQVHIGDTMFGNAKYGLQITDRDSSTIADRYERSAFFILLEAAGDNDLLEPKEMKRHLGSKTGFQEWDDLLEDLKEYGDRLTKSEGLVEVVKTKALFFPMKVTRVNQAGAMELAKMRGFKNYLETFTIIDEREINEVGLWKYYLIYAALFGCADRVYAQLKRLVPNFSQIVAPDEQTFHFAMAVGAAGQSGYSSMASSSSGSTGFVGGGGGSYGSSSSGGGVR
ncbi:hypothetical protein BSR29_05285 [Boudabousia liubingyangii]|uniref:DUF2207 domain-containing protein n=1 Tax=Boudabousia liubingyangii TaxID=1921764 RepID=A0A1Q5PLH5_9ACTO|nr:DUF2207 domain-containing protein [Boudabousia liubingyangii]OKL47899.1 hypothetical protein BSR29_05285 [Boudabousia liubingyangii]